MQSAVPNAPSSYGTTTNVTTNSPGLNNGSTTGVPMQNNASASSQQ
jgi:hypothetical protein